MPQVGFACCDGTKRSFADCIAHASTHQCQWTAPLLQAMAGNIRETLDHLTITELLGCPRATVWRKTRDYFESPETGYAKWRGSLFHHLLDKVDGTALVEQRFFRMLGDRLVSGQPDVIYPDQFLLLDYKTTKYIPNEPYPTHTLQLNAYRWLVAPRYKVLNLEVVYLDMGGVRRVPVALEELDLIEARLLRTATAVLAGLDGELPDVIEESGRWQCGYCPFQADCWPNGIPKPRR